MLAQVGHDRLHAQAKAMSAPAFGRSLVLQASALAGALAAAADIHVNVDREGTAELCMRVACKQCERYSSWPLSVNRCELWA